MCTYIYKNSNRCKNKMKGYFKEGGKAQMKDRRDQKSMELIKAISANVKSNNSVQNKAFTSEFNYCHFQLSAM